MNNLVPYSFSNELKLYSNNQELYAAINSTREVEIIGPEIKSGTSTLQPVRAPRLTALHYEEAKAIEHLCDVVMASCISYETAECTLRASNNPIERIKARMKIGRAEGIIGTIFNDRTLLKLLWAANRLAPVQFHQLLRSVPKLKMHRLLESGLRRIASD